jgi:hypothetical protein
MTAGEGNGTRMSGTKSDRCTAAAARDVGEAQVTRAAIVIGCLALLLGGCAGAARFGQPRTIERPQVVVNASVQTVRDVITDSARRRGSAVVLVGDGLVLERPLPQSSQAVRDACGPHRPNRTVRVVLRTQPQGAASTLLSEERFIVDGGTSCPLAHEPADLVQARDALGRIKSTAEEINRRITAVSRL